MLVRPRRDVDLADVGGVGGTLAGNAMSLCAMRAVLGEVLTDEAFETMEHRATSFVDGRASTTIDAARAGVVDHPARGAL